MLKPIPDYPNYFADESGRIWLETVGRLLEVNRYPIIQRGHGAKTGGTPRYKVRIRKTLTHSAWESKHVARLVLSAFYGGNKPREIFACHKNSDSLDDRLENLYWGTPKQNARDASVRGTTLRGSRHPKAKLNEWRARIIYRYSQLDKSYGYLKFLSEALQTPYSLVASVVHGNSWSWAVGDKKSNNNDGLQG